jgi:hypothetical protein
MNATELLSAACPEAKLVDPKTLAHEKLEVVWAFDNTVEDFIAGAITGGAEDRCFVGFYQSDYEGTFATFLRRGLSLPLPNYDVEVPDVTSAFERVMQDGMTPDGPVRSSFYLHGADLAELRRAGVTLSWGAARCVHAAFREPLAQLHAAGWAHGALTTRRLRLVVSPEPYVIFKGPAPVRLCAYRGVRPAPGQTVAELVKVAEAVCALTSHPDPTVAALLAESTPEALDRLATLLLARRAPIDVLLADRLLAGGEASASAALELRAATGFHDVALAPELTALWQRVAERCPLVEGLYPLE